jgi:hypothetical protein
MSESIDYTAEGEAFGASYADGLALGLHGSELPEGEEGTLVRGFMSHLFKASCDLACAGTRPDDLDLWFRGGMTGFGRRLDELRPAASLADRTPLRPQ